MKTGSISWNFHLTLKTPNSEKLYKERSNALNRLSGDCNRTSSYVHRPSIQRDLFSVCLRFPMYKFAFSADIVKMFRQIWVNEKHRNFQKIVWREDPSDPIKHFQLCTEYPNASKILLEDFYVDDVLTGSNSEDELLRNRNELVQLMSRANLELGKWVSNTPCIQTNDGDTQSAQTSLVKVLGLYWHPEKDILTYNVGLAANPDCSKRQVLSDVSRIFDPLGLLAPIVIQFKILFQKLWLLNLDWDDPLPTKLADNWLKWRADLDTLQKFRLPRLVPNDPDNIELHGFSDASTKAYAAVVYSRVTNDDESISVSIVAAKTRVAPLKQPSLPRLELCAALLLSQLIRSITSGLRHKNITVFGWSDSSIVLSWLSYAPAQLKTFVGNRTSEILDSIPRSAWRHVDSKTNPADCASRGLMAADLIDFHLWWNGPQWLRDNDQYLVKLNDSRPDLTFLAALRRFISLRGKCSKIYSDNGTNFIGAKRSLDEMQELLSSQTHKDTVSSTLADDGIQWVLIPPRAPHWGGKWESAVRCVKLHLRRITGNSTLTLEQMRTLLAQISAVINSRPLCHTPDTETNYLSPAYFLIGRPLTTVPDPDLSHIPVGRLGYWQSIQSMLQGFWKKWHQEYLTTLQQRPKWTTSTPNISTGNVVLVKESNLPPASWHIARVMETYPGKDDLVRAVKLKTQTGEMTRPITKVAVLSHSETVFQGGPGCS
ncbi:uncharacterized protein [Drosophila takahashii]|uniref:uncharacterized protein n=1 Tax=Drosophila takahashii TaxID=29030 RepID=UPI0038994363